LSDEKLAEFLFSKDPICEILSWLLIEFMKAESEAGVGDDKNKNGTGRKIYLRGHCPRHFDIRLGTICLLLPQGVSKKWSHLSKNMYNESPCKKLEFLMSKIADNT
jgi:hypothetical protein